MFVDYSVFNTTNGGYRAGTFRAITDGVINNVVVDDTSTADLNAPTSGFRLYANVEPSSPSEFSLIGIADTDKYDVHFSIKLILI